MMRTGIVLLLLLTCGVVCCSAKSTDSSSSSELDSIFERLLKLAEAEADNALLKLAPVMAKVREKLPHEKLNVSLGNMSFSVSEIKSYALSVAKVTGAGFCLGVLVGLVGLIYVPVRCLCSCCRRKKHGQPKQYETTILVRTLVLLLVFSTIGLFGSAVGMAGNLRFTTTLDLLGQLTTNTADDVLQLGTDLGDFVDEISPKLRNVLNLASALVDKVPNVTNTSGAVVDDLKDARDKLAQVAAKLAALNVSAPTIDSLRNNVNSTLAGANQSIADIEELQQRTVSEVLKAANDSLTSGASSIADAENKTAEISTQVSNITTKIAGYVDDIKKYTNMVVGYDRYRLGAFMAILVLPFLMLVLAYGGFFTKQSWLLLITMAFAFLVACTMLVFGVIHLMLGMAVSDACSIAQESQLPENVRNVIDSCTNGTILDALNMSVSFNASSMAPTAEISSFENFVSSSLDFGQMSSRVSELSSLSNFTFTLNETEAASALGYNFTVPVDTVISDLLGSLNGVASGVGACTDPSCTGVYYDVSNYTSLDVSKYDSSVRTNLTATKTAIGKAVQAKSSIDTLMANISDIQALLHGMNASTQAAAASFATFNTTVSQFLSESFTGLDNAVNDFVAYIDSLDSVASCEFVPNAVNGANTTVCSTMLSCADLLAMGMCTTGLFAIPCIVMYEFLIRMSKKPHNKVEDIEMAERKKGKKAHGDNAVVPERIVVRETSLNGSDVSEQ